MQCIQWIVTNLPAWISPIATILAAWLAAFLAIRAFYKQREYELVKKRYLEEGFDLVISRAETALNTFGHNWARSLELLKTYRDDPASVPKQLDTGVIDLPSERLALTASYRVNAAVNNQVVWNVFQLIVAFAQEGCNFARSEVNNALRQSLAKAPAPSRADREKLVTEAMKHLMELNRRAKHFYPFVTKLHDVAMILERQKFTHRDIESLRSNREVIAAMKSLEEMYGEDLAPALSASPPSGSSVTPTSTP